MKSQTVRLIDVFYLGPLMVWIAGRPADVPPMARTALGVAGLLTIIYNGENWQRGEQHA